MSSHRTKPVSARIHADLHTRLESAIAPGGNLRRQGVRSVSAAIELGLETIVGKDGRAGQRTLIEA